MAWAGVIAISALAASAVAVFLAWRANRIASNPLAADANMHADDNDRIAPQGSEVIAGADAWTVLGENCGIEGNDVVWEPEWVKETTTFTVTNIGPDTASDVCVVLTVDDVQQTRELAEVRSGECVLFDLNDEAEEAYDAAGIAMEQALRRGFSYVAASNLKIGAHITWRAPSGLRHVHDFRPHFVPTKPVGPR